MRTFMFSKIITSLIVMRSLFETILLWNVDNGTQAQGIGDGNDGNSGKSYTKQLRNTDLEKY